MLRVCCVPDVLTSHSLVKTANYQPSLLRHFCKALSHEVLKALNSTLGVPVRVWSPHESASEIELVPFPRLLASDSVTFTTYEMYVINTTTPPINAAMFFFSKM